MVYAKDIANIEIHRVYIGFFLSVMLDKVVAYSTRNSVICVEATILHTLTYLS